jgi:methionyl-tRNA formyltransferase
VAETALQGEQVRVHRARALPDAASGAAPGAVLGLEDDMLVVACGRGRLGILELQRAGRRSMTAKEFANGLRAGEETFT